MPGASAPDRPQVVVVTGGGGGIGAAVAEALGRRGTHVVTLDPLVSVDGSEELPPPTETTAGRIVAAGGSARASTISVADREGVRELFARLVEDHGGVDGVVNVAGISRPTSFASGREEDWREVLTVHLDGYLNVLDAALPVMAAAGQGRILGVTSGSGWRSADTGAYGCAKRAVASLTWQLGRLAPPGVVVNAMSPIAVTRMVTEALGRAGRGTGSSKTGGLSLGSMPEPRELGPFGAHLVDEGFAWCSGQVIFTGGSEVALIDEPRLLEVVRAEPATSLPDVLHAVTTGAWVPAERDQATGGGSNPRFGGIFDAAGAALPMGSVASCAVVTDRPEVAASLTAALGARGVRCTDVVVDHGRATGFDDAAAAIRSAVARAGSIDAVAVALAGAPSAAGPSDGWRGVLREHTGLVDQIHTDAGWARAVADEAGRDHPIRLLTLTDAAGAGGRSRAQASAQLARAARRATGDRVTAFAVSVEAPEASGSRPVAELVAHLLCSADTPELSGAELVAGAGWFGLRSHPRPRGSITFGGPEVPGWFDGALRDLVGSAGPDRAEVIG